MKKYRKPILDIVEFDNLDVVTMSSNNSTYNNGQGDEVVEDNSYAMYNESQLETSLDHANVTGTSEPADSESGDPLESIPADENTAENQNDDSTDSTENPADDDGDETAAQAVPEDEVE